MPMKEIVQTIQARAANLALRLPISWVNLLTGPAVTVDGRILDARTQWLLQLLARSGHPRIETLSVEEARREVDAFMPTMAGGVAPVGEILDRTIAGPGG